MSDSKIDPTMPNMRHAFRITESEGDPDPAKRRYSMVFKFNSIEAMHAADDEWRTFHRAQMQREVGQYDPNEPPSLESQLVDARLRLANAERALVAAGFTNGDGTWRAPGSKAGFLTTVQAGWWQMLVGRVRGETTGDGEQVFAVRLPKPVPGSNIMRGSVAQHFSEALEAEFAREHSDVTSFGFGTPPGAAQHREPGVVYRENGTGRATDRGGEREDR